MNETIQKIKRKPGFYFLATPETLEVHTYIKVEVDEKGNIYQLNRMDQRDGILSDDGWMPGVMEIENPEKGLR